MLTGTPLQNEIKDVWSLLSFIDSNFPEWTVFNSHFSDPIKQGMSETASKEARVLGNPNHNPNPNPNPNPNHNPNPNRNPNPSPNPNHSPIGLQRNSELTDVLEKYILARKKVILNPDTKP
jgi:SNF2 family DNA or RNA helicase